MVDIGRIVYSSSMNITKTIEDEKLFAEGRKVLAAIAYKKECLKKWNRFLATIEK